MSSLTHTSITLAPSDLIQQLKLSLSIPQVVQAIQRRQLIFKTAKAYGVCVDAANLQAAADQFRLTHNLLGSEQTWAWLNRYQLSLEELELRLHEQLLTQQLAEHLFGGKVEMTFAQQYRDYCKVALYEIVLDDFDFAMELFYALQAEEVSFAVLARDYAATSGLRRRGGYLGKRLRSELPPEIAAVVFSAEPPQLLRPVLREGRSHLVFVEERTEPQLTEKRRGEILNQLFEAWVAKSIHQMEVTLAIE